MDLSRRRRNPFAPTAQRIGTGEETFRPVPLAGLDAGVTEDAATRRLRTYLQHLKRTDPDRFQAGLNAALKRKKPATGRAVGQGRGPAVAPGYSHPDAATFALPHQAQIDRFLGPPSRILKHAKKGFVEGWGSDDPLGLDPETVGAMARNGLLDYRDVPGLSVVPDTVLFGAAPLADAALRAPVSLYHGTVNALGQTNRELGSPLGPSSRMERDLKAMPEAFLSRAGGLPRTIPVRRKGSAGSPDTGRLPVGPPRPNQTVSPAPSAHPDSRTLEVHNATRRTFTTADIGHDLPKQRQMPIETYYGGRMPETDHRGRLTHTPEGDPLVAPLIVGRIDAGRDRTLSPRQMDNVINSFTRKRWERADESNDYLEEDLGVTYGDPRKKFPTQVLINRHLRGRQAESIKAHEFGHVVRKVTQPEPRGLVYPPIPDKYGNDAARAYHHLNTGKAHRENQKLYGPVDRDPDEKYPVEEIFAEAMRAYLTDPNAFKTLYPAMGEFVRKVVNRNPDLRKVIQFNSAAGAAALTGYGATDDPRVKTQPEARKTPAE